ncbi:hypothetical protein RJ639_042921, partial [Escallonia herrerae]
GRLPFDHQVRRANSCVLDAETFCSIRLEQLLYVVLFAMQSHKCHLLVRFQTSMQLNFVSVQSCRLLQGTEMAQLVCGGCHTLLMYIRGATSVRCSCCHTVNLAMEANQVAHVNCGNCRMLLMYQYGARSVKCAVCNFVTSVGASTSTTEQKFTS